MALQKVECGACGQPILGAQAYKVGEVLLHSTCIRCAECKQDIVGGQFFLKENKPVCIECGSRRKCVRCGEIILRGGWDAGSLGFWHDHCFLCSQCQLPITSRFQAPDGKPTCSSCYAQLKQQRSQSATVTTALSAMPSQTTPPTSPHGDRSGTSPAPRRPAPPPPTSTLSHSLEDPPRPSISPMPVRPLTPAPLIKPTPVNVTNSQTNYDAAPLALNSGARSPSPRGSRLAGTWQPILNKPIPPPPVGAVPPSFTTSPAQIPTNPSPAQSPVLARSKSPTPGSNSLSLRAPAVSPTHKKQLSLGTMLDILDGKTAAKEPISALEDEDDEKPPAEKEEELPPEKIAESVRLTITSLDVGKQIDTSKRLSMALAPTQDKTLLLGEDVLLRCEFIAWLVSPTRSIVGTMLLTTGAVRFIPAALGNPKLSDRERRGWRVYHGNVHRILRLGPVTASSNMHAFEIVCKTPWSVRISTTEPDMENRIWNLLESIAFRGDFAMLHYRAMSAANPQFAACGWAFYDPLGEYRRMGVPGQRWRVTEANVDYKLCPTYPKYLVVPKLITDDEVRQIAKFRSKGRMPAVVYLHPNQAVLARCAQPRTGLRGTRCEADEKFFSQTLLATTDPRQPLRLMDARPHLNAMANALMGAGYEREGVYENCKRKFLNIENIHVMRTSINKLRQLCALAAADGATGAELESKMFSSGWFDHLALILQAVQKCVDHIRQGHSVILHCSDGWDRTPQLTALTQLCLDPHFRTIRGFIDLIEKEWCSFGHMFRKRCGHGSNNFADKERSPIFTQFLDAVFQVISQYATVCEFNERFLLALSRHLFSCRYGTFLPSTDDARVQLQQSALSVWSRLELPGKSKKYTNPQYQLFPGVLPPLKTAKNNMKLWRGYFLPSVISLPKPNQ